MKVTTKYVNKLLSQCRNVLIAYAGVIRDLAPTPSVYVSPINKTFYWVQ